LIFWLLHGISGPCAYVGVTAKLVLISLSNEEAFFVISIHVHCRICFQVHIHTFLMVIGFATIFNYRKCQALFEDANHKIKGANDKNG